MTELTIVGGFDAGTFVIDAIDSNPLLGASTKRQYTKAISNYLDAGHDITDPVALARYAETVGSSTRSFLKASIGILSKAVEQQAEGSVAPDNVLDRLAIVYRAEALRDAIKVKTHQGQKAHTWLSQKEVAELLSACDHRKSGNPEAAIVAQRDRLAIGLLVAAGLRRAEAVNLKFSDVKVQPVKDKMRTVLDVKGKGAKDRVIPISDTLANAIRAWGEIVEPEGIILRSLGRNKQPGESMTTTAIYHLVQKRAGMIGKPELQPHDLRRTYAQLGLEAGIPISQISILLGHSNIATTQRYLHIELDLDATISDFIPFS